MRCSGLFLGFRRGGKVQRVPEALQLPVIIERARPSSLERQHLHEFDLLLGGVAAQGLVPEEFFKARFYREGLLRLLFYILESLQPAWPQPAVQDDFHAKSLDVDIPGVDHRIEERDAILNRDVEDVGVEEL